MLTEKLSGSERDNCLFLCNAGKSYNSGKNRALGITGVDFVAKKGFVTGLLGANGAGLSTLLRLVSGVTEADSGEVSVFGQSDAVFIRHNTGFVPEFPELDPSLSVRETLLEEMDVFSVPSAKRQEYFSYAVEQAQLGEVLDKKIRSLSKGFKQRTSFAKALCHSPSVLVLDEYSGGLDPSSAYIVRKCIKDYAKKAVVVVSTHQIDEALSLCDTLYIMQSGRVAACGTAQEICASCGKPTLEEAYLFYTQSTSSVEACQ